MCHEQFKRYLWHRSASGLEPYPESITNVHHQWECYVVHHGLQTMAETRSQSLTPRMCIHIHVVEIYRREFKAIEELMSYRCNYRQIQIVYTYNQDITKLEIKVSKPLKNQCPIIEFIGGFKICICLQLKHNKHKRNSIT